MAEPILQHQATDPPLLLVWHDQAAAISVEYAIMAALLAIMAIAGPLAFGEGAVNLFSGLARDVGDALAWP